MSQHCVEEIELEQTPPQSRGNLGLGADTKNVREWPRRGGSERSQPAQPGWGRPSRFPDGRWWLRQPGSPVLLTPRVVCQRHPWDLEEELGSGGRGEAAPCCPGIDLILNHPKLLPSLFKNSILAFITEPTLSLFLWQKKHAQS